MAVKIKLARYGKIREPYYRVVVADARTRRNGRAIETIGRYSPKADPSVIQVQSERAQYWLGVGAQPTEAVVALLKVTGDWQKFNGLPGAEGTLRPQPEKVDRRALYDAAVAAAGGTVEDTSGATTAKKRPAKKAEKPEKADKSEKPDDADKSEKPGGADKAEKADGADKSEKADGADKGEKADGATAQQDDQGAQS